MKNLVIVESPAKAKTIEGFLGKDFTVKSSFGHIRDLPQKNLSVDTANGYAPDYVVPKDKEALVRELKKLAKAADMVWLASDEDREGEAISWHLFETLGLDDKKTRRIVFHEITKSAILQAVENPRPIDQNLVNAQQARRILDRLVGYELSPVLWKKVKPSLSAGRVQSVAVRLIVEREREVDGFNSTSAFRVLGFFTSNGKEFRAELSERFATEAEAKAFLEKCKSAIFTVTDLQTKPAKRTPAAPFTTSTLQQEASRKLGLPVARTMQLAQNLYEEGHITYMRTDSTNLSGLAINSAKDEIISSYGEQYHKTRQYAAKAKGAQEAHEAIRPTYMNKYRAGSSAQHERLYELIWKRTIASQMADAELERTTIDIQVSGVPQPFVAKGEVIKFDGFLKVYMEDTDDENTDEDQKGLLPSVKVGQQLGMERIEATERFTQAPPRYTEASLVRKLEELGIGRPSTYAPTISTVINRGYVVKEDREGVQRRYTSILLKGADIKQERKTEITGAEKAKLFPTDIGVVVTDFLVENFKDILDYNFTAQVELEFDEIAEGKKEWVKMIDGFYLPFHEATLHTSEHSKKATGERLLGVHPESGKNVMARLGKFGPMIQVGDTDSEEKPAFASLLAGQRLSDITLEQALDLFKLPRRMEEFEGKVLSVGVGRFGPFVKHGSTYTSIPKGEDPLEITRERAVELVVSKREAAAKALINTFNDGDDVIEVKEGRFGPYIAVGKDNFKIPKGTDPASLTLESCKTIMASDEAKPKGRFGNRAKANAAKTAPRPAAKSKSKPRPKPKAK
ncbi:MAG: type I DNA topoisomerase [Flavobacteriales bacterium]|nr:type I DNA topoisomerase [Flavobacteriales bacterium]